MTSSKVQQEEKPNRWQWILFVIVIPSLFAAFFLLLIIKVAGIDVAAETKQWTANVPLISEWIDWKKKERALEKTIATQQQTIEQQQETIARQKKQIRQLQNELTVKEHEIARLSAPDEEPNEQANHAAKPTVTADDIAAMYGAMSEKQAAAILAELPNREALDVLSRLEGDKAAAILEQMPIEQAANLLSSLSKWETGEEVVE